MGRTLAIVESMLLFTTASAMGFLWGYHTVVDAGNVAALLGQAAVLAGCCIVAFAWNDLYDLRITQNLAMFVPKLVQSVGLAFILLGVCYIAYPAARATAGTFVSSFLMLGAFIVPLRAVSYASMRSARFMERVLILGTSQLALRIAHEINAHAHLGYEVVGVVDDGGSATLGFNGHAIGPLERFSKLVDATRAQRIIVALAEQRGRLPVSELLRCQANAIVVEDGVEAYERLTGTVPLEWLPPSRLLFSPHFRRSRRYERVAGALGRLTALVGLVLTAPLLAFIAAAIKLESRDPVLFVQERVGLHGRPFRLLKFRTMVPDPRPASEWVRDNASRITMVGQWLRKLHLDELPQLVNVVRGDMAFVGPRPHPTSNYRLFADGIPHYALRSRVRPGVTGWAQVRFGYANNLQEETEKMRFDLFYIKHLSLWLDGRIVLDTVKLMLVGRESWRRDADAGPLATLARGERGYDRQDLRTAAHRRGDDARQERGTV